MNSIILVDLEDPMLFLKEALGKDTIFEVVDAGQVWNEEMGINWTKPGEFMQYTFICGEIEFRVMRQATLSSDIHYHLCFGANYEEQSLGPGYSFGEMREAVLNYVFGGG